MRSRNTKCGSSASALHTAITGTLSYARQIAPSGPEVGLADRAMSPQKDALDAESPALLVRMVGLGGLLPAAVRAAIWMRAVELKGGVDRDFGRYRTPAA